MAKAKNNAVAKIKMMSFMLVSFHCHASVAKSSASLSWDSLEVIFTADLRIDEYGQIDLVVESPEAGMKPAQMFSVSHKYSQRWVPLGRMSG